VKWLVNIRQNTFDISLFLIEFTNIVRNEILRFQYRTHNAVVLQIDCQVKISVNTKEYLRLTGFWANLYIKVKLGSSARMYYAPSHIGAIR
jgi:hypothetical protein